MNIDSGLSLFSSPFGPGINIHIASESVFTSPRNFYSHAPEFAIRGKRKEASKLLPRVHLVASLLKRWLTGTHQGAVSHKHLPYYIDEFTFRFNRRTSRYRWKLFYRLVAQAVAVEPVPYSRLLAGTT